MKFAVEIKRDLKTTTEPGRYLPYISEMKSLKNYSFIQAAMQGLYKSVSDKMLRMDMPEILQVDSHVQRIIMCAMFIMLDVALNGYS